MGCLALACGAFVVCFMFSAGFVFGCWFCSWLESYDVRRKCERRLERSGKAWMN